MSVEKMIGDNMNNVAESSTLNTAVLFLVFNRLDTTIQVFKAIQEVKPPRLYIASDGARNTNENEKVKAVREYILSNIDWDCEVKTLFREQNFGCKMAVSGAIDWFFDNEEKGIILEDDCLPNQSFFRFCEELLEKYKDEMRIGQISGDNFQKGIIRGEGDYYFSIYNHIWGWASWANRWKNYDVTLKSIENTQFIDSLLDDKKTKEYWLDVFNNMKEAKVDTWDYQWTFTLWNHNQLTILPNKNLIENIGFGEGATHTTGESELANLKSEKIVLNRHPEIIIQNKEADEFTSKLMFQKKNFFDRVINKLKRMFNGM